MPSTKMRTEATQIKKDKSVSFPSTSFISGPYELKPRLDTSPASRCVFTQEESSNQKVFVFKISCLVMIFNKNKVFLEDQKGKYCMRKKLKLYGLFQPRILPHLRSAS